MEHIFFRYLTPGAFFLIPVYIMLMPLEKGLSMADASVMVLPLGYVLFQVFRMFWLVPHGGYERLTFIEIIRGDLKVYVCPDRKKAFVDFGKIIPSVGIRWFTDLEFKEVFDPFSRNRRDDFILNFLEPLSDFILFSEPSYNYARSISTIRYSALASIVALIGGTGAAFIIKYTVLPNLYMNYGINNPISWLIFFLAMLMVGMSLLRTAYADFEYNARLLLLTIINLDKRKIMRRDMEKEILPELKIFKKFDSIRNLPKTARRRIAAFDMDDTLLIGDVGDAVLAELIIEKKLLPQVWSEYQKKLGKNRDEGYEFAVKAMAGLTIADVLFATRNVLNSKKEKLIIPNLLSEIKVPKPFLPMQSLLFYLQNESYDIYIVTATNIWTSRLVASEYFNINEQNVMGMEAELNGEKKITDNLISPKPCGKGKVEALAQKIGDKQLMITAGNSESDFCLLKRVKENGIAIWVSNDGAENPEIRDLLHESTNLVLLDQTKLEG